MDAVEEIKSRLAIEDIIGEYVQLKRTGRNWKGLSPFTNEKTPSFVVSPEKQIWHDFSSNKGGTMFSFVMEMEGLDFKGALELLARKAGVDLDQYRSQPNQRGKQKEQLYPVIEMATKFYQTQFSKNKTALEYILQKRGFTKETALKWRIGYSPNTGNALVKFLNTKGFKSSEVKQAGLSSQRYSETTDIFRGRIMIPLTDPQGKVIGFTARSLNDVPGSPKYINTPQTILYNKSQHVFGLNFAKEAIRTKKYVVVVEGNLDVLTSHQAGVKEVVATAGTAITELHLKMLSRFTSDIRLCFDADEAGVKATERAIPLASRIGINLSVIVIPIGKDPDELIRQNKGLWEQSINQPKYALDWLMDYYSQHLDLNSAPGKKQFSDVIMPVVQSLVDKVEQDHYIQLIADLLGISSQALRTKLQPQSTKPLKRRQPQSAETLNKENIEIQKIQDRFLALMLMQPKLRDFLATVTEGMLINISAQQLLQFLHDNPDFAGDANAALALEPVADYVKILLLQYETLYQDLELLELRYEVARLQARLVEQYVKNQKREMSAQFNDANETETETLLAKAKQLDILLRQNKEA